MYLFFKLGGWRTSDKTFKNVKYFFQAYCACEYMTHYLSQNILTFFWTNFICIYILHRQNGTKNSMFKTAQKRVNNIIFGRQIIPETSMKPQYDCTVFDLY